MSANTIPTKLHNAPTTMPDPGSAGTIIVERSPCIVDLVTAAAETRTLARPTKAGVEVRLHAKTIVTSCTITPTGGYDELGGTTIVFSNAGEFAILTSFYTGSAYFWRLVATHATGNLSGITATAAEINARAAAASRRVAITDAATYTLLAADSGKIHVFPDLTQSCTVALPALADGLEYTFIGKGVAADASNWIFQVATAGLSFLGGLVHLDTDAGDAGDEVVPVFPNGSSNDFMTIITPGAGTRIHLFCDGTNWIANGVAVSATAPTFSDT